MVNAVLEESKQPKVVELQILNPYNPKEFLGGKLSIVDIKAKNETGEWFLIEVQIQMYSYFPQRLLYYWAKNYQTQLKEGEQYHLLQKVNIICVCQESLPIATEHYYNLFRVQDVEKHVTLSDHLSIYTLELPKFVAKKEALMKQLEQWAYFLKHGESLDDEKLPKSLDTPEIRQAVSELKKFTLDEVERGLYEARLKAVMDEKSKLYDNYLSGMREGKQAGLQEGEQIGIQKGKQEGRIEAAKNMLRSEPR
jgi:predicted transposase/invertase (TIGR01784 family)